MLSLAEAEQFLRGRYRSRLADISPLGGGAWSLAYACTLDGRQVVARFGVHGEDFAKDELMAGHSSAALPIPSAAPGCGLWTPGGSAPHSTWREALLDIVSDRPGGRAHGWRQALEDSATGAGPFDHAAGTLRALAERLPQPPQLIHGDLLNRNVLVRGPAISAVLDWGNSMYGDWLYDLAWLLYWRPWFPGWRDIDVRDVIGAHLAARGGAPADAELRLRCYQLHFGLDAQAYTEFTGRWQDLAANARQTMKLATR
jgi:hygromycin-B 4-O-kinase